MPGTQFETGHVSADDKLHAVKKRIDGAIALCGAGRIVQLVPGRFDSGDPRTCTDCAGVARQSAT